MAASYFFFFFFCFHSPTLFVSRVQGPVVARVDPISQSPTWELMAISCRCKETFAFLLETISMPFGMSQLGQS